MATTDVTQPSMDACRAGNLRPMCQSTPTASSTPQNMSTLPNLPSLTALRILLIQTCESWAQHCSLARSRPTLAQILSATPDNTPLSSTTKALALTYLLETLPTRIAAINPGSDIASPLSEINATLLASLGGRAGNTDLKGCYNKLLLNEETRMVVSAVEGNVGIMEVQRSRDLGVLRSLVMSEVSSEEWTAEAAGAVIGAMTELGVDVSSLGLEGDARTAATAQDDDVGMNVDA